MYSKLTDEVCIAHSDNYKKGRSGYTVCKITPHQMAGKLTGKQCAKNIFGVKGRKASANYCIGYNGDIVCNVEEEDRAYTSSSAWNDNQAITIEVSNSANGTDKITEASWNSLVNLCVDVCTRYNFRLTYTGDKNGSLTRHNMYANTSCPGAYLQSRFPELVQVVNAKLDGATAVIPTTPTTPVAPLNVVAHVTVTANVLNIRAGAGTEHKVVAQAYKGGEYDVYEIKGDWGRINGGWFNLDYTTYNPNQKNEPVNYRVRINTYTLNVRDGAGTNYKINTTVKQGEIYTIVEEENGFGKLKSGAGWISLKYTIKI